eukprot:12460.XXX_708458_708688_1 [CDS] Oithona nana genome sequencing.
MNSFVPPQIDPNQACPPISAFPVLSPSPKNKSVSALPTSCLVTPLKVPKMELTAVHLCPGKYFSPTFLNWNLWPKV